MIFKWFDMIYVKCFCNFFDLSLIYNFKDILVLICKVLMNYVVIRMWLEEEEKRGN